MSRGPYLVEHNVFASRVSLEPFSQGGAYVHNLVCGTVSLEPVLERPTPYHMPHSTQVAGYAAILGGDDRIMGNVFLGGDVARRTGRRPAPSTARPWHRRVQRAPRLDGGVPAEFTDPTRGDHQRFAEVTQSVYIRDNVYLAGAKPYEAEQGAIVLDGDEVSVVIVTEGDAVYLETSPPAGSPTTTSRSPAAPICLRSVSSTRSSKTPDGSTAVLDTDLVGVDKTARQAYPAGPLARSAPGPRAPGLVAPICPCSPGPFPICPGEQGVRFTPRSPPGSTHLIRKESSTMAPTPTRGTSSASACGPSAGRPATCSVRPPDRCSPQSRPCTS